MACAVAETSPPLAGRCRTCKAVKVIFLETNRSREKESGRCNIRTREELAMKRLGGSLKSRKPRETRSAPIGHNDFPP